MGRHSPRQQMLRYISKKQEIAKGKQPDLVADPCNSSSTPEPEHEANDTDSWHYIDSTCYRAHIENVAGICYKERVWELPPWVDELITKLQQPSENIMTKENMAGKLRYAKLGLGDTESKLINIVDLLGHNTLGMAFDCDIPQASINKKFHNYLVPRGVITPQPSFTFGYHICHMDMSPVNSVESSLGTDLDVDSEVYFPYMIVEVSFSANTHGFENRCLSAAATCLRLSSKVLQGNLAIFTVVVLPVGLAEFFVMWKDGDKYIMKGFRSFALYEPDQHIACQMLWSNIRKWAMGERLENIKRDLQKVYDERRKRPLPSSEDLMYPLAKRPRQTHIHTPNDGC
ncbi:uncharacterized protein F4817DRAFT_150558 [Daldinia loculata]|uniref:uncharacterized protein n=1 Tax=Daldinia loculata TaxID=103429 RepID=UPI0020C34E26|nr:uncharacterized protein F4817DRAFT_150558 [Daldinia loculata]KAI1646291.1 hypothetical protein F4817DRAFT_150558 [Daldinia loculata]